MIVDRDEVEDRLVEAFAGRVEVTGAGTGIHGSNLDLEFSGNTAVDDLVHEVGQVLALLSVGGARVRFQGADGWIRL